MLELTYPTWYLMLCVALAALMSYLLYYFRKTSLSRPYTVLLSVFRFLSILILLVLLLKPILKYSSIFYEKPLVVIGVDASESMLLYKDSSLVKENLMKLLNSKNQDFEWKVLSVGEKVESADKIQFDHKTSEVSAFVDHVNDLYAQSHVAGAFLITDGLFNSGNNPLYQNWNLPVGLNVIAVGDSSKQIDVSVSGVQNNSIAFKGNKFPLRFQVLAEQLEGEKVNMTVRGFGKLLYQEEVEILSNSYSKQIDLLIVAEEEGYQPISIEISSLAEEQNKVNNKKLVYINVQDNQQKILLVYDHPSPDVAAVRSALEKEEGFDLTVISVEEFERITDTELRKKYNSIVAFQIPVAEGKSVDAFNRIRNNKVSAWFIGSAKTNYSSWFASDGAISWKGQINRSNAVSGIYNDGFSLFKTKMDNQVLKKLPPVQVPFIMVSHSANSEVLLNQSIGGIKTGYPLWMFTTDSESRRRSYFFGSGLWRWRLDEFRQTGAWNMFDQNVSKTVQFLASKKDLSRLRVFTDNRVLENQDIEFRAEFLNESFELINTPDLNLVLKNGNKSYDFLLKREGDSYYLNTGSFSPGQYSYRATVSFKGDEFVKTGSITVEQMNLEYINTRADYPLLINLADKNEGKFFELNEIQEILAFVDSLPKSKKSFEEIQSKDLIHQKWLFALLALLLGVEWMFRKREGVI